MQRDIYLRTIPHTGTRFVASILDYLGVRYKQWHFGWPEPLGVVPRTSETRYIVTARNPYDTWESLEFDGRTWGTTCLDWYDELLSFCESMASVFVLSLDVSDRQQAITDLAAFCGVEYNGGFTWEINNRSGCQHGDCPNDVKKTLHGAYQWYGHHTGLSNG